MNLREKDAILLPLRSESQSLEDFCPVGLAIRDLEESAGVCKGW